VHCGRLRQTSAYETKRLLRKHFLPAFKSKTLEKIAAGDVTKITDKLRPSIAAHAIVAIGTFFNWAVGRQYLASSPLVRLRKPPKSPPRSRLLTDDDLKTIWRAAAEIGWPYGTLVQLAITTGQRRGQLAALRWSWIDPKAQTISFPAAVMKGKKPHTIPYADLTATILKNAPATADLIFPNRSHEDKPFNGWSKNATTLRKKSKTVQPFVIHDFRRAVASGMASLSVPISTVEKCLAHQSHSFAGIVQVYQLHSWIPEMKAAFEKWENRLKTLLEK
jgi:integrase